MNEILDSIRSWIWVPVAWGLLFPAMIGFGVLLGPVLGADSYWWANLILLPLTVAPITYKMLVGGGCSVRFQICALVKGMLAGFVFFFLTIYATPIVWPNLSTLFGWPPLSSNLPELIAQIWLYSAVAGGMGARFVEVRGLEHSDITIAGFDDMSDE
ncbi:MAG: hypothetical protein ACTSV3_07895 [Candidatus Thorarchaeota archaeon]|nr:MAG: hypothetical protein DRP09_08600 [Candidatus Thorarchaeota archaeon]RLI59590.1 MAG: hypothetical protein DRO87_02410 [Candidatus Thorarchaeota archaeon]